MRYEILDDSGHSRAYEMILYAQSHLTLLHTQDCHFLLSQKQ